jgi:splicing factor 3A subunit 1
MAQDKVSGSTMDIISKAPEGVVLPPKELRTIIEKVRGFSVRNGAASEQCMRSEQANVAEFSFIFAGDLYYDFNQWRRDDVKSGHGTDVAAGRVGEAIPKFLKSKGPELPSEFLFGARMPTINAQDLEIVKLTALWVAKNGRGWMIQLSQRDANNFQFDFSKTVA